VNAGSEPQSAPRYRFRRRRWQWLCVAIDAIGAHLIHWFPTKPPADPANIRSLLIIQLDHLGDAILSLGLIREIKAASPHIRLEVLCSPWTAPLFSTLPEVDRIHVSRQNRFRRPAPRLLWLWDLLAWSSRLRRHRFDAAIDIRGELPHALLMWLAGIPHRIGHRAGGGEFLLTAAIDYQPYRHQVSDRAELLAALRKLLGQPDQIHPRQCLPTYVPPLPAISSVAHRLQSLSNHSLFVLHLGAGTSAKRWPAEHWHTLAQRLLHSTAAHLIVVGTPDDCHVAQNLVRHNDLHRLHDWTGTLTIPELAALLGRADLFVGADSGPAHLAAAVGIPTLVLFSGTNDSQTWRPMNAQTWVLTHPVPCSPCARAVCPLPAHPCLRNLSPARVHAAIQHILSRRVQEPPVAHPTVNDLSELDVAGVSA
jgi:lipopolysaccharide heptosyltransferase II